MKLVKVEKRSGKLAPFSLDQITKGIHRAANFTGGFRQEIELFDSQIWRGIYKPYTDLDEIQIAESLALQARAYLRGLFNDERGVPHVEQVQDAVERTLYDTGFTDIWESFRLYRWTRTAVRDGLITETEFRSSGLPDKKVAQIKAWNQRNGCETLAGLNEIVRDEKAFKALVRKSTRSYERGLDGAVKKFLKNPKPVLVVAGPSSSGKTTSTDKIVAKLTAEGYNCKILTLDNYYFGLDNLREDDFGDYDYEKPDALDIPLIRAHLDSLLAGETVDMPFYNFEISAREGTSGQMNLEDGDVLVIDSLYALSSAVFTPEQRAQFFKVYVEPYVMMENSKGRNVKLTDNRLLRRMARDSLPIAEGGRGHTPGATLGHWHYVRNAELRYLIPLWPTADHVVNTSFAFEFPALKGKLEGKFPELIQYRWDGRLDAFVRGSRVKALLDEVEAISDQYVPASSMLREFIGPKR